MLVIITIISTIGACIAYFINATDLVDSEIRGLGATQQLSYQKAEIENSLIKWLEGRPSPACNPVKNALIDKFTNFQLSDQESRIVFEQASGSPATPIINFNSSFPNVHLPCFMNPNRYREFSLKDFKAEFFRIGQPNYMGLSNEVGALITFEMHYNRGAGAAKIFRQKYNFRYRLEASSLGNYGLIFTRSPVGDTAISANSPGSTKTFVLAKTLVLGPSPELTNLASYGSGSSDYTEFQNEVHVSSGHLVIDNTSLEYVKNNGFDKIFTKGIVTDAIPSTETNPGYIYPTNFGGQAWQESFNYYYWDQVGHLPLTSSLRTASPAPPSGGTSYYSNSIEGTSVALDDVKLRDTNQIFSSPLHGSEPANVFTTCAFTTTGGPNQSRMMTWANMNNSFTIDLRRNTDAATPPVFCGMIAARDITIILNDLEDNPSTSDSEFTHHYLIGKFIVSNGIKIQGKGKIHIIDGLDFQKEDINLPGVSVVNPSLIQQHIYSFSYTSYRNFFMPFLRANTSYTSLGADLGWITPMSVIDWGFTNPCPPPATGFRCPSTMNVPTLVIDSAGKKTYPLIDLALPNIFFKARNLL